MKFLLLGIALVVVAALQHYVRIGRRLPQTEFEQRKAFFNPPSPAERERDLILDGHGRR